MFLKPTEEQLAIDEANKQFIRERRALRPQPVNQLQGSERVSETYRSKQDIESLQRAEAALQRQQALDAHKQNTKSTQAARRARAKQVLTAPYVSDDKARVGLFESAPLATATMCQTFKQSDWLQVANMSRMRQNEVLECEGECPVSDQEQTQIAMFCFSQNPPLDIGDQFAYRIAFHILRAEGVIRAEAVPEPELPEPIPEPVAEEKNPHRYGTSEYDKWDHQKMVHDVERELTPIVRTGAASLGIPLESNDMRRLFREFAASGLPLTVESVRHVALKLFPHGQKTEPERLAEEQDQHEANLSAEEIRRRQGIPKVVSYEPSLSGFTRKGE